MLRGRRSCTISERTTPAPSSKNPLSPLFPLHPENLLVTPLFPLLTQKQGGGGTQNIRISFALTAAAVPVSNTGDSNRLVQERTTSEGVPYTNCKPIPIKPPFTRELIEYVGAPTFLILWANEKSQNPPASEGGLYKNFQPLSSLFSVPHFQLLTFNFEPTFSPNSNYSRTSETSSRKSNHSRTYAKTRGWGCLPQNVFSPNSFVFFRCVNYILNYMHNHIVGAPTFATLRTKKHSPRNRPKGRPLQKWEGVG